MSLLIPPQRETAASSSLEATGSAATSQEDARHRLHVYITSLRAVLDASPTDDLSAHFAERYAQADMDARDARATSHAPPPV